MKETTPDVLSTRLEAVLSEVHVRPDCLSATVRGRTVTADSPRALTGQLATALYAVAHVGRPATEPATAHNLSGARDLEAGLARGVPHERTRHRGSVLNDRGDGGLVVGLSGIRVRVPRERVTVPRARVAGATHAEGRGAHEEEADVLVAAARPSLSPGFFLVDGSLPLTRQDAILRVYLHVETPGAALDAWGRALRCLEDLGVPYRAKAASSAHALPRRDGVVVYLESGDQHVLPGLVEALEGAALGADTSPLTRPLAPGVAVAWEPDDSRPGMRNTSFGEHRSRVLAVGLIRYVTEHATEADGPHPNRSAVVGQALLEAGIDPLDPARNLSSPPFFAAEF
ncbi:T3SS effector HopA1 family protein [Streptomyces peucetius]|uniref:T3SS effector HopA1 family protein n=1 Tax=Streptomyces peucetius TaxID=1950 RepID=A0ABY6I801_STRPE|nr:T3SS effector HopA1 family protein [Streptomyces peucetius]UYQ63116.1 T3SS effector HopA1 family protein [Streptomyces peucetius]